MHPSINQYAISWYEYEMLIGDDLRLRETLHKAYAIILFQEKKIKELEGK